MSRPKYLTKEEKKDVIIDEIILFVEKLEKKFKVEISYNAEMVRMIKSR